MNLSARLGRSAALCTALLACALPSCSSAKTDSDAGAEAAPRPLDAVPAPAGLVGDLFLPAPDATWSKVRAMAGGPAMFVPQGFGGLVASFVGLPLTAAIEIDGDVPVLGAILEGPGEPPLRGALGIHVKDGKRLIQALTAAPNPRFTARSDAATLVTLLEPIGAPPGGPAIGVLANYLLVSKTADDLKQIGPYVARTLPRAAVPAGDLTLELPQASLAGPVLRAVQGARERLQAGIRLGPASLRALLPIEDAADALVAIAGDLKSARLTLDADASFVRLRAKLVPSDAAGPASKAAAGLEVGDASRLLDLPPDTLLAVFMTGSVASPGEARRGNLADSIRDELDIGPKEAEQVASALGALSATRARWTAGGLRFGPTGMAGYARSDVAEAKALEQALAELVGLTKLAGVKARLKAAELTVDAASTSVEGVAGQVQRVRFARAAPKPGARPGKPAPELPNSIDLLYTVRDGSAWVSAGFDAPAALAGLLGAPSGDNLGAQQEWRSLTEGLGKQVAFALAAEPLRLVASRVGKPGSAGSAPVVLAYGRQSPSAGPPELWARLDVATALIGEIVKHRDKLFSAGSAP